MRIVRSSVSKRFFSISGVKNKNNSALPLKISEEIQQALNDKNKPVVSLESTIITHGLPYPQNMIMATETEKIIRNNGAIPATCAFIDGLPTIGLTGSQLEYLSEQSSRAITNKVSRRDIGYTMARGVNGGTTISSTMVLSHLAGIKVFATGGLGGVHRGGQLTMDVSADLNELNQTPVAVVCAGPKSILDIGLTMEYLETQGVFVGTYNDDKREAIEIPGFYCRESGIKSPYSFNSFKEAAAIIHHQNKMNLNSGSVFCVPPPQESALSTDFINNIINSANEEAKAKGISGKDTTPFLLSRIAEATGGKSVECNIKFVYNNAKCAAEIAKNLLQLETREEFNNSDRREEPLFPTKTFSNVRERQIPTTIVPDCVDTVVVGSIALDTSSRFKEPNITSKDSNPGHVESCIGGVGYNISLACKYGLKALSPVEEGSSNYRLVSVVANDFSGKTLINQLGASGIDTSGIHISTCDDHSTAQYISIHDERGDLIIACADMSLLEEDLVAQHIKGQLLRSQPKSIVFDCNISAKVMNEALEFVSDHLPLTNVIIEPTSSPKARRIGQMNSNILKVFPNNLISLVTPTIAELKSIYSSFKSREHFDGNTEWLGLLDSIGVDSKFTEKLSALGTKHKILEEGLKGGYLQQSFQLLPFLPNILLKLGSHGALYLSLSTKIDHISIPTTSQYSPEFVVTSKGKKYTDINGKSKRMGIIIQYFPIPSENVDIVVKNVTGAGDSLLGYLLARLSISGKTNQNKSWLASELEEPEEWAKWESLHKAQIASGLSLQSSKAVSLEIENLK